MLLDDFYCDFIPRDDLWKISDDFRSRYWPQNTLPIDIEHIVETGLKMNIIPIPDLNRLLDIDALLSIDLKGIMVDQNCYMDDKNRWADRLRFSFAHEIGHLLLHKDVVEKMDFETPEEYHEFLINVPDEVYNRFEYQANEFAGRLLVPPEKLRNEIQCAFNTIKSEGLLKFFKSDPGGMLSQVSPTLRKPFGVSDVVIEIRAHRERLWPPKDDDIKE